MLRGGSVEHLVPARPAICAGPLKKVLGSEIILPSRENRHFVTKCHFVAEAWENFMLPFAENGVPIALTRAEVPI